MSDLSPSWPPQTVATVCDDLRLEAIGETADRAARYARRAASAARRRDLIGVHVRLRQARLCLQAVIETLDDREAAT